MAQYLIQLAAHGAWRIIMNAIVIVQIAYSPSSLWVTRYSWRGGYRYSGAVIPVALFGLKAPEVGTVDRFRYYGDGLGVWASPGDTGR